MAQPTRPLPPPLPGTKEAAEVLPVPVMSAGGKIMPIVPQTFQEAANFAGMIVRSGMAPKSLSTADKVCVAILHGMEVGLPPMAAIQSIAVINGMPGLFGDGMLGVVRASGLLEDIEETQKFNEKGECVEATCRVKRKGEATWGVQTITLAMITKAGWINKEGPWTAVRPRMMQLRARGWALRDKFSDVTRGLRAAEEIADIEGMTDITPQGSATVPAEEPRRDDPKYQASAGPSPQPVAGQGEPQAPTAGEAATPPQPSGPPATTQEVPKPTVTDVVDLSGQADALGDDDPFGPEEKQAETPEVIYDDPAMEFTNPGNAAAFIEIWSDFLKDRRCGPNNAARWLKAYAKAIAACEKSPDKDRAEFTKTLVEMTKKVIAEGPKP